MGRKAGEDGVWVACGLFCDEGEAKEGGAFHLPSFLIRRYELNRARGHIARGFGRIQGE